MRLVLNRLLVLPSRRRRSAQKKGRPSTLRNAVPRYAGRLASRRFSGLSIKADFAEAPAQGPARIVGQVPERLAQFFALVRTPGQSKVSEQRPCLAGRWQGCGTAVADHLELAEDPQLQRGAVLSAAAFICINHVSTATFHARLHAATNGRCTPFARGSRPALDTYITPLGRCRAWAEGSAQGNLGQRKVAWLRC
jgi:hypothetical protein